MPPPTDKPLGPYRRIYLAFVTSSRFNALPEDAELLFWRLLSTADDYGNLRGEPELVRCSCLPLRNWNTERITNAINALVDCGLVSRYENGHDNYLHLEQFEQRQATKNGKRYQLHPHPDKIQIDPGASKKIQVNPGASKIYKEATKEEQDNLQMHPGESRCIQIDPDESSSIKIKTKTKIKNPPTPFEEPKPTVKAWLARFLREPAPHELKHITEWEYTLDPENDPLLIGNQPQDAEAVIIAAINTCPTNAAAPSNYIAKVIANAKTQGVMPEKANTQTQPTSTLTRYRNEQPLRSNPSAKHLPVAPAEIPEDEIPF